MHPGPPTPAVAWAAESDVETAPMQPGKTRLSQNQATKMNHRATELKEEVAGIAARGRDSGAPGRLGSSPRQQQQQQQNDEPGVGLKARAVAGK